MFKLTAMCIFLTLQIQSRMCEVESFSAVAAMVKLLETQAHLIESIGSTLQSVDRKEKGIIETYIAKLKKEHALSQGDPEHYLGNPINSYALIMRLYRDLQFVEKILNNTDSYKRNTSLVYPSKTDVEGAYVGLVQMQVMYGLDIRQIADGILGGDFNKYKERFEEMVSPLTTNDCLDLAQFYFNKEDRTALVCWLKIAYNRFKTDRELCDLTEDVLLRSIARNYGLMEDWNNTVYWLEKYLAIKKNDYEAKSILENAKRYKDIQYNPKPRIPREKTFGEFSELKRLCRYESGPVPGNMSLSCYYAHGPHPFLLLAPFRAEILHRGPDITMFYDVISDVEIEMLKAEAKPKLRRANVVSEKITEVSIIRTCQTATMTYKLPAVVRVMRRIRQFSGLQSHAPDHLDVKNYGLAGYYMPHYDIIRSKGVSTVLLYISNVEQGGATVFLSANLTVFPVKNAALFWYNLDDWGFPDYRTKHCACPVVRGSKWSESFFTHPGRVFGVHSYYQMVITDGSRLLQTLPNVSSRFTEKIV